MNDDKIFGNDSFRYLSKHG